MALGFRSRVYRNLYKLMAYKDEYEVARLLSDPEFDRQTAERFEAPRKVIYHLHPPLLRALGLKKKLALGPWFRPFLRLLAGFKGLRAGPLDLFGRAAARQQERELIDWYRDTVEVLLAGLREDNFDLAFEVAGLPDQIRGYEEIKAASIDKVLRAADEKLAELTQQSAA